MPGADKRPKKAWRSASWALGVPGPMKAAFTGSKIPRDTVSVASVLGTFRNRNYGYPNLKCLPRVADLRPVQDSKTPPGGPSIYKYILHIHKPQSRDIEALSGPGIYCTNTWTLHKVGI